MRKKIYRKNNE